MYIEPIVLVFIVAAAVAVTVWITSRSNKRNVKINENAISKNKGLLSDNKTLREENQKIASENIHLKQENQEIESENIRLKQENQKIASENIRLNQEKQSLADALTSEEIRHKAEHERDNQVIQSLAEQLCENKDNGAAPHIDPYEISELNNRLNGIYAFLRPYRDKTKRFYNFNIDHVFRDPAETRKFIKAASPDFEIISCNQFQIKCTVKSDSSDNLYQTSLTSCNCKSFEHSHKPCKHMIYLALALGCVAERSEHLETLRRQALELDTKEQYIKSQQLWWEKREKELEQKEKRILDAEEVLKETGQTHPGFAALMQHYDEELDRLRSQKLALRAPKSKETVDQVKEEKRQLIISNKQYLAQIAFYEAAFPWLTSIKDLPIKEAVSLVTSQYKGNNNEFRDRITTLKQYGELRNAEMEINQMLTELEHQVENK